MKEIKETEEYGPQYYSQRGEDCPPRYDNNREEFLSDMVKSSLTSSQVLDGCAMI